VASSEIPGKLALTFISSIPENIRFEQKDIEMPWQDLNPGSWDLVYMRALNGSIANRNWPKLYAEAFRCVSPGIGMKSSC
jgi:hypothetical protein